MILIADAAVHPVGRAQGALLQLRTDAAQYHCVGAGHARANADPSPSWRMGATRSLQRTYGRVAVTHPGRTPRPNTGQAPADTADMILIADAAVHPVGRAQGALLQLRTDAAQYHCVGAGHARANADPSPSWRMGATRSLQRTYSRVALTHPSRTPRTNTGQAPEHTADMILIYDAAMHPVGRAQGALLQLRTDAAQYHCVGASHAREQPSGNVAAQIHREGTSSAHE
jgi:hypothetical protein